MNKKSQSNVKNILLASIKIAGLLTIAATAPNALQAFFPKKEKNTYRQHYYARRILRRLVAKGLIHIKPRDGYIDISLTDKGHSELLQYELGKLKLKKPKKWDKKYRVIIFDIDETKKKLRDQLRWRLRSFGFLKIQNSVWVYPYDC